MTLPLVNDDISLVPHTDYILVISIDLHCAFLSSRRFLYPVAFNNIQTLLAE